MSTTKPLSSSALWTITAVSGLTLYSCANKLATQNRVCQVAKIIGLAAALVAGYQTAVKARGSPKAIQNIGDLEVTEKEFQGILRQATSIRDENCESLTFNKCCDNINLIFKKCHPNLQNKIRAGIITSGGQYEDSDRYSIHGIDYLYHVVLLLKKDGDWYIVDPLMGSKVTIEADIGCIENFKKISTNPIAMKANNWMLTAFDTKNMERRLAVNTADSKSNLYRMRVLGPDETDCFATANRNYAYRSQEKSPLSSSKPGSGKNLLNLSDMIKLFNRHASFTKLSKESETKTGKKIAASREIA